jgi:hypothetical protein
MDDDNENMISKKMGFFHIPWNWNVIHNPLFSLSLSDSTTVQSGPWPLQLNASNSSCPQLPASIFWPPAAPSHPGT